MLLKNGCYSAIYLKKTAKILKSSRKNIITTVQFFQREDNVVLCGIKHVIKILKSETIKFKSLKIESLRDGDIINNNEPVLKITGELWKFIHLEGIIDGILARESSIATNSYRTLKECKEKSLIYMNDRNDYYYCQQWDGYAANIGGIKNFVTPAQIELIKNKQELKLIGTVPHALIQSFNGDLVAAIDKYHKYIPEDKIVGLVDYHNDVVKESLELAKVWKEKLFAVRVDTSKSLIDKGIEDLKGKYPESELSGVNIHILRLLRLELDKNNFKNVKIIASSGLNAKKIFMLEKQNSPVDIYGVGKSLANIFLDFTCDAVIIDGKLEAKFGRGNQENPKLKLIK